MKQQTRCVIVGGAKIANYSFINSYLKKDDFFIYCDCGLNHADKLEKKPNLIVGDFDSHKNLCLDIETIVLPCEKDDTDTVFAVKEAIKRGFSDFLLIGVVGQRFDHTLGNIAILQMLDDLNKTAMILDDYSEIEMVSTYAEVKDNYKYFSLLNISGIAEEICIDNAKYPVQNATITCTYPIGISNEVLPNKTAKIKIGKGKLLLVKIVREGI